MAERSSFIVSFDGPSIESGRMDVRDLAPALLSLGRLIDAANLAINGDRYPIKVEARATSVGSFEVSLDVVISGWAAIKSLLGAEDVQSAKSLLEWIGILGGSSAGLFTLYRFLNGSRAEVVRKQPDNTFKFEIEGRNLVVPFETMRLYQEFAVHNAVGELLKVVENEAVSAIKFISEETSEREVQQTLTKKDIEIFSVEAPPPVTVLDSNQKMALSIRTLAFQEGNKWRLFDGQNTITATIEDKDFIRRIDESLVRFAKGDILICTVRTIQTQGPEGLKTEHRVLRIDEHRGATVQIELPFDARD